MTISHQFDSPPMGFENVAFDPSQAANLLDVLCQKVIKEGSIDSMNALFNARDQLKVIIDLEHVQLYAKAQAVLFFATGDYESTEKIIRDGFFEEHHHPFFQNLYRIIEERKRGTKLRDSVYVKFPVSIDPVGQEGIPKSALGFIKNYYIVKMLRKQKRDVKLVASMTGLTEEIVEDRFKYHREAMSVPKTAQKGKSKQRGMSERNDNNIMMDYNQYEYFYQNQSFSNSPEENVSRFPLTRIPIDQPLSIEIPEDLPIYLF